MTEADYEKELKMLRIDEQVRGEFIDEQEMVIKHLLRLLEMEVRAACALNHSNWSAILEDEVWEKYKGEHLADQFLLE